MLKIMMYYVKYLLFLIITLNIYSGMIQFYFMNYIYYFMNYS